MSEVLPVNIKDLAGSVATLARVLACNNDCKLAHDLEQCRDLHYLQVGQCFHCHFCVFGSLKPKEELWKKYNRRLDGSDCSTICELV